MLKLLQMTAHTKNILWNVFDAAVIILIIALLAYFIGIKVIWKNKLIKKSYSRKWMLNRYKRGVFKEESGVFVILGYRNEPQRKGYKEYDYSFVYSSDTMWHDAVAAIIGDGDQEMGVKFERNDARLRIIMIPCKKWIRPFIKGIADRMFSK